MHKAYQWLPTFWREQTNINTGQRENSVNNNTLHMGKPRTGKNYGESFKLEPLLNSGNAKAIFPHVASSDHLAEVLQYTLPNGWFVQERLHEQLETIRENLQEGEYEDHEVVLEELEGIEDMKLNQQVEALEEIYDREENRSIRSRIRYCLQGKPEENKKGLLKLRDQAERIENMLQNNDELPRDLQKAFGYWGKDEKTGKYEPVGAFSNSSVRMLVPISMSMPDNVDIPEELVVPYGIPADDYAKYDIEEGLKIIFGERKFKGYYEIYKQVCSGGRTTYTDLKDAEQKDVERSYAKTMTYGSGQSLELFDPGSQSQSVKRFRKLVSGMFNTEGIICSSDFHLDLRSQLKQLLLSPEPEIIMLYTGYIHDQATKKFVITHFMETFKDIIQNLSKKEMEKLDWKYIIKILEAQELLKKSTQDNNLDVSDRAFNNFMSKFMNNAQHNNADVWLDTKPDDAHPLVVSRTEHHFLSDINHDDLQELFQGRNKRIKERAKACFKNPDYTDICDRGYGFIDLSREQIPKWQKPGDAEQYPDQQTYGFRLPAVRQCVERPLPISDKDFSYIVDAFGYEEDEIVSFEEYQDMMFQEDWREEEQKPIKRMDEQLEEAKDELKKEQQEKKEYIKESVKEKLKNKVKDRGLPSAWKQYHEEIIDEMDLQYTVRTVEGWTEELREKLTEMENKAPEDELDPEEISNMLIGDERFIFGATSDNQKISRAVDLITEYYDVSEGYAEDIAEKSVNKAKTDLNFEQVISSNHSPKIEREEFREYMEGTELNPIFSDQRDEIFGKDRGEDPDQSAGESEEDPVENTDLNPDNDWDCSCGAFNEKERVACYNCGKKFEEVHEDAE